MFKLSKAALLGVLAIAGAFLFGPSPAHAAECAAVAFRANGDVLEPTFSRAVRVFPRRACRVALRRCWRRLDRLRFRIGRRLPFAECEIVGAGFRGEFRHGGGDFRRDEDFDDGPRGRFDGPSCNIQACSNRYRSFRASDCSFQPFDGPRRRCAL